MTIARRTLLAAAAAALAGLYYGYDIGSRICGTGMGVVMALNAAICATLAFTDARAAFVRELTFGGASGASRNILVTAAKSNTSLFAISVLQAHGANIYATSTSPGHAPSQSIGTMSRAVSAKGALPAGERKKVQVENSVWRSHRRRHVPASRPHQRAVGPGSAWPRRRHRAAMWSRSPCSPA